MASVVSIGMGSVTVMEWETEWFGARTE
jgi:hypothetical protein